MEQIGDGLRLLTCRGTRRDQRLGLRLEQRRDTADLDAGLVARLGDLPGIVAHAFGDRADPVQRLFPDTVELPGVLAEDGPSPAELPGGFLRRRGQFAQLIQQRLIGFFAGLGGGFDRLRQQFRLPLRRVAEIAQPPGDSLARGGDGREHGR